MNTYTDSIKKIAMKYLWEPVVHVNTSSEAIVQYITTFGFAIIYYLGISNMFVGFSLLYNVHKSLIQSFPNYVQDARTTAAKWVPSLIPHIPIDKDQSDAGIPNVASNPCNLDSSYEGSNEVQDWGGEDSSENEFTEITEMAEAAESSSESESSDVVQSPDSVHEGVRPPSNSMETNADLLLQAAEKLEESLQEFTEENVDGHPHSD
jgi:hypothetical protein